MENTSYINELTNSIITLRNSLEELGEYTKMILKSSFVESFESINKQTENFYKSLKEIGDDKSLKNALKSIEGISLVPSIKEVNNMKKDVGKINDYLTLAGTAMSGFGIAVSAATLAFDLLKGAVDLFFKDYFDSCKNITQNMNDFYSNIEGAGSIFEGFNKFIFDTNDNTIEWKKNLDDVQRVLSELSKKGHDMSKEDSEKFKENYDTMKGYYEEELKLIEASGNAVQKRAEIAVMTGDMTVEQMQRLINDTETQKDTLISKISEQYEEEVLLLAQKYSDENGMITEEGEKQLQLLKENRDYQIQEAHAKCGKTLEILTNGYYDQMNLQNMSKEEQDALNAELLGLEEEYSNELVKIQTERNMSTKDLEDRKCQLQEEYKLKEQSIREKHYKNITDFSDDELGVLVSMCAMTETYGGKMNTITSDYVMKLIENWDSLPKDTKEVMKNALEPMIEEMDKKRTPLFQKAKDLADGILSRLRKTFDINSPSRKTREIFRYLMEGCELGLEDEKAHLLGLVDSVSNSVLDRMYDVGNVDKMFMAKQYHLYSSANSASVSELNRKASAKGIIHTTLNIDGREFAIATSNYMQEELAFKR